MFYTQMEIGIIQPHSSNAMSVIPMVIKMDRAEMMTSFPKQFPIPKLCFFLLIAAASVLMAQNSVERISGRVTYLSGDVLYINLGKASGLELGSKISITDVDGQTWQTTVTHLSSSSAVCRIPENAIIEKGAKVSAEVILVIKTSTEISEVQNPIDEKKEPAYSIFTGYGTLTLGGDFSQVDGIDSQVQPHANMHYRTSSILKFPAAIALSARYSENESDIPSDINLNHLEIGFGSSQWNLTLGRLLSPRSHFSGYVDGATFETNIGGFQTGALAGISSLENSSDSQMFSMWMTKPRLTNFIKQLEFGITQRHSDGNSATSVQFKTAVQFSTGLTLSILADQSISVSDSIRDITSYQAVLNWRLGSKFQTSISYLDMSRDYVQMLTWNSTEQNFFQQEQIIGGHLRYDLTGNFQFTVNGYQSYWSDHDTYDQFEFRCNIDHLWRGSPELEIFTETGESDQYRVQNLGFELEKQLGRINVNCEYSSTQIEDLLLSEKFNQNSVSTSLIWTLNRDFNFSFNSDINQLDGLSQNRYSVFLVFRY